jgi:uncharacterized cupin superfamily protein
MQRTPIRADSVDGPTGHSNYPQHFASVVAGRTKRRLGDAFGLTNFGVNLTQLAPGAASALVHQHSHQDEFLYVLEGHPTLLLGDERMSLDPGNCVGFKAGDSDPHQLINETQENVVLVEVGDRSVADQVVYPDDDIQAAMTEQGIWAFTHKDGTAY